MEPIAIPDELGIQGAVKQTISGGDTGAQDVEALVGVTDDGVPFFAMLIEVDALDMRSLHLDRRFWLFQLGVPLHPFSLETAFVDAKVDEGDVVSDRLEEIGRLLATAWHLHATGNGDELADVLDAITTKSHATETVVHTRRATGTAYQPRAGVTSAGLRIVSDVEVNGRRVGTVEVPLATPESCPHEHVADTTTFGGLETFRCLDCGLEWQRQDLIDGHVEPPSLPHEDGSSGPPG